MTDRTPWPQSDPSIADTYVRPADVPAEPTVEAVVEDDGVDVYTRVSLTAAPSGAGVRVRTIGIGDGYPAVLIQLHEEEQPGDLPLVHLDVFAGGLGFTDYEGALASVVQVLEEVLVGLKDPAILATAKTMYSDQEGRPAPDPVKQAQERATYESLIVDDDEPEADGDDDYA
jgi:hypothetical protein